MLGQPSVPLKTFIAVLCTLTTAVARALLLERRQLERDRFVRLTSRIAKLIRRACRQVAGASGRTDLLQLVSDAAFETRLKTLLTGYEEQQERVDRIEEMVLEFRREWLLREWSAADVGFTLELIESQSVLFHYAWREATLESDSTLEQPLESVHCAVLLRWRDSITMLSSYADRFLVSDETQALGEPYEFTTGRVMTLLQMHLGDMLGQVEQQKLEGLQLQMGPHAQPGLTMDANVWAFVTAMREVVERCSDPSQRERFELYYALIRSLLLPAPHEVRQSLDKARKRWEAEHPVSGFVSPSS